MSFYYLVLLRFSGVSVDLLMALNKYGNDYYYCCGIIIMSIRPIVFLFFVVVEKCNPCRPYTSFQAAKFFVNNNL